MQSLDNENQNQVTRLALRPKRLEDASNDYLWRTDPELAELDATAATRMSFMEYRRRYEDELRYPTPWVKRFAIEIDKSLHIGNCMAYDIDTVSGQAEVGIMIGDKAYWSKGFGRIAMSLLVDDIFVNETIKTLYLHTLEWNNRARKSFASVGFNEVRRVRRAGKDFILMQMDRT